MARNLFGFSNFEFRTFKGFAVRQKKKLILFRPVMKWSYRLNTNVIKPADNYAELFLEHSQYRLFKQMKSVAVELPNIQ